MFSPVFVGMDCKPSQRVGFGATNPNTGGFIKKKKTTKLGRLKFVIVFISVNFP